MQLQTYHTMDRLTVTVQVIECNTVTLALLGSRTQELGSTLMPPPLSLDSKVCEVPVLACPIPLMMHTQAVSPLSPNLQDIFVEQSPKALLVLAIPCMMSLDKRFIASVLIHTLKIQVRRLRNVCRPTDERLGLSGSAAILLLPRGRAFTFNRGKLNMHETERNCPVKAPEEDILSAMLLCEVSGTVTLL